MSAAVEVPMDDLSKLIPPELQRAVAVHGFHKLAAKMYGVDEINEKTAAEIIGTKLAARRAEWRGIFSGLQALNDVSR